MEDQSNLAADSLAVSSMAAGNMQSDNKLAMTAPGSPPVDPLVPAEHQGDPRIGIGPVRARTVLHPSGAPRIGNPWGRADGTAWEDASPDIDGGRAPTGPWRQS